jgi:hypothetical protein
MAVMVPLAFPDKMAAEAAAADIAIGLDWFLGSLFTVTWHGYI